MTSPLLIASDVEDAAAADAVLAHHAQLAGELATHVAAVLAEALAGASPTAAPGPARTALVGFCRTALLPHAAAEEVALYPLAQADPRAWLLVEAMLAEHRTLARLVDELVSTGTTVEAATRAAALRTLVEQHLAKENDLVLPLLAAAPEVSLAGALAGMHDILGGHADHDGEAVAPADGGEAAGLADGGEAAGAADGGEAAPAAGGCGGSCGCGGGGGEQAEPVLDVREFPHALRHGVVFGALDAVPTGGALILLAPHDPVPLLRQLEERRPGAFGVQYLETGPQTWQLRLERSASPR